MMIVMIMILQEIKNANESSDLVLNYLQNSMESEIFFHFSNFPNYCRERNCLLVEAGTHICFKILHCQYLQKWKMKSRNIKRFWQHSLLSDRHLLHFLYRVNPLILCIRGILLPSVLMDCSSFELGRSLLVKRRLDTLD
jgi:hypothetical protein